MCKYNSFCRQINAHADVAELADALDLGSSVDDVGVQVPSSAPRGFERFFNLSNLFVFMNTTCYAGGSKKLIAMSRNKIPPTVIILAGLANRK